MASQTLNRFRLIDCLLHNVHRAVLQLYPGREKKSTIYKIYILTTEWRSNCGNKFLLPLEKFSLLQRLQRVCSFFLICKRSLTYRESDRVQIRAHYGPQSRGIPCPSNWNALSSSLASNLEIVTITLKAITIHHLGWSDKTCIIFL